MANSKGMGPLAWIAIGCGALLLLIGVGVFGLGFFAVKTVNEVAQDFEDNPGQAAAEMMVRMNPELELVDSDREAGTITFRNKKSGEEVTADFEDIREGKLSFQTADGTFSIDGSADGEGGGGVTITDKDGQVARFGTQSGEGLPDWLPIYPGAEPVGTMVSSGEMEQGSVTLSTEDPAEEVLAHYEEVLEAQGYEVERQLTTTSGDGMFANFKATGGGEGRDLNVTVMGSAKGTQVQIAFGKF